MNEERLATAVITIVLIMLVATLVVANIVRYGCCTGTAYKMPVEKEAEYFTPDVPIEPSEPDIIPIEQLPELEDVEEKNSFEPSRTTYLYGGIAEFDGEELKFYHTDYLGSTRVVTNQEAEVVYTQDYLPFGKEMNPNEDFNSYTGKKLDEESELFYYGARYYDADLGRFTQMDPIQTIGSNYVYAADNPYKFTDPRGQEIKGGEWSEENIWRDVYHYNQFAFYSDADWETQKGRYVLENIGAGFLNIVVSVNNFLSTTSTGVHLVGAAVGLSPEETDLAMAYVGVQSYLYADLIDCSIQYAKVATAVKINELGGKIGATSRVLETVVPKGLSAEQYSDLQKITAKHFDELGLQNTEAYITGSAARGVSHKTGLPFGAASDIDLNIVGEEAWALVKPNKVFKAVRLNGEHVTTWTNPAPALTPLRQTLSEALGHPVNIKVFRNQEAYMDYLMRSDFHPIVPVASAAGG